MGNVAAEEINVAKKRKKDVNKKSAQLKKFRRVFCSIISVILRKLDDRLNHVVKVRLFQRNEGLLTF